MQNTILIKWSSNLLYQVVSDKDYFADFNNSPETNSQVFRQEYQPGF